MSEPYSKQREEEFKEFLRKNEGKSYTSKALGWFIQNLRKVVTAKELARITGRDGYPINHSLRRVFELRDEKGYEIINWKDDNPIGKKLRVDEWILLEPKPNPEKIRNRGVNKRIMFDVFERDNHTCQVCGRNPNDDDPFKEGHKIRLHVGHIKSHKQKDGSVANVGKKLTKDDFITMCNVCNEGAKNRDVKKINLIDRVKSANDKEQKEIFGFLKKKFN